MTVLYQPQIRIPNLPTFRAVIKHRNNLLSFTTTESLVVLGKNYFI